MSSGTRRGVQYEVPSAFLYVLGRQTCHPYKVAEVSSGTRRGVEYGSRPTSGLKSDCNLEEAGLVVSSGPAEVWNMAPVYAFILFRATEVPPLRGGRGVIRHPQGCAV